MNSVKILDVKDAGVDFMGYWRSSVGQQLRVGLHESDPAPYSTWRSRLVHRIMRRGRKEYHHKLFFGEKGGDVLLLITTHEGEIVAQCHVVNPDLLVNLIEHVNNANAQAKLVNDG